jgi:prophage tail gpP-like protein
MQLKIKNISITNFNDFSLTLKYNSVASKFAFWMTFNPDDPIHKEVCRPFAYHPVTITHDGQLLLTGTLLNHNPKSRAEQEPLHMSGYSKTGVLEDCEIPLDLNPPGTDDPYAGLTPLQSNKVSLKNITEKLIKPFGLKLVVDSSVTSKATASYIESKARDSQTIKQYISEIASQKHVIITHDVNGNLVFTEAKASQESIYDFTTAAPGVAMEFELPGQEMHGKIKVQKQQSRKHANSGKATVDNPYVPATVFRPRRVRQSSGSDVDTPQAARNKLSEELSKIKLKIYLDRWELNKKLVMPNNTITVTNPELYLYKKTKFFIEEVEFNSTSDNDTTVLTCVLPEVYNNQPPKNIFL